MLLVLIASSFVMHRRYAAIVSTQHQVIEVQRKTIVNWQLRALACEDGQGETQGIALRQ
jgi:hypothetical protein